MERASDHDWAAALAAAQSWWREAGVDMAFADAPRDWLAAARIDTPGESPQRRGPQADGNELEARGPRLRGDAHDLRDEKKPRIGGDRARWPADLARFADWWLTEPSLDPAGATHRVAPSGPPNAPLMVLVAQPEAEDRETLLAGPQGRLLDAILAAFGLSRETIYLASVLPRPAPVVDWASLAASGMTEVVAHHVALAAPRRLLVFGRGGVSALLGHDPAQAAPLSLVFNHGDGSIPLAFAPALETLLERPALKQGVWTRWLEWTGTE